MSIEDILTLPETFTVDGKEYKAEFDCRSYGILEALTGKSIYKLQELMCDNNLFMTDTIELICASLIKHHKEDEIDVLRKNIKSNLSLINEVRLSVVQAFFKGIAPPEIFEEVKKAQNEVEEIKKKIETEV